VAFVREEHVRHRDALRLHHLHDLITLGLFDARIVRALPDQERLLDLIGAGERAPLVE